LSSGASEGYVGGMSATPPLPPELWDKTPADVRQAISALVVSFERRIARLEARLGQDSSNSSRPPSSDGPRVKRGVPRTPSGRRRGGQEGHPKHERVILPPDEVVDHKPTRCGHCDHPLDGDDPEPVIDQVIELPPVMRHVIHHRRHTLACPRCQARTTAGSVPEAARGFGPRLQAATAYLGVVGRLGKRPIRQLLADLHGIPISTGSVSNLEARTGLALRSIHDEAMDHTRGLDANVDETGWKQGRRKAWLWVAVTKGVTAFLIRRHRDRGAFDDLVGPSPGVLTTDRYSVYAHLDPGRRQVCWAHLRRDFQAMIDRRDRGSEIGEDLLLHADVLAEQWPRVRDGARSRAWFSREILPWLREEVRLLLEAGSRCGGKTAGVCGELLGLEASLWTFATVPGVEPTNNAAERAVRHAVCWRKTSHGTDSERGSRFVERVLTVMASRRSQGRGVLDFLTQAITAHQSRAQMPSLLPEGA
jgi:transposase